MLIKPTYVLAANTEVARCGPNTFEFGCSLREINSVCIKVGLDSALNLIFYSKSLTQPSLGLIVLRIHHTAVCLLYTLLINTLCTHI